MMQGSPVVLVNMPMAAVERPSLGLGLLKALLEREGIAARAVHPNMWLLEYIGVGDYHLLEGCLPEEALVDWLFAGVAFPEMPADDGFLDLYFARNSLHAKREGELRATFLRLRAGMADFVDWTADRILAMRPALVGCTSTFSQHVPSLALLRRLRERAPEIVTLLGGANCESVMGRTTHQAFPWVDYVVSGEADALIGPLCRELLVRGRDIPADELPFGVFGPRHRTGGYPVSGNGDKVPRAVVEDMRGQPLPDFSDYFAELADCLYGEMIVPGLPMEFSRGCWWGERSHCTFCGLNGGTMSYRQKPATQAAEEMIAMAERYGSTRIEAVDNILALDYFEDALPRLAEHPEKLSVFFEVKANLKRHEVEQLAAAGVRWIQPGIESLDTRVLKLMGKGTTAAHNVQLLKWCRQYGVRVSWSVLWGFPGESDDWYAQMTPWLEALHHLQPGRAVRLRYQRYSPYHQRAEHYGLQLAPAEPFRHVYPLTRDQLSDLVYYFEDIGAEDPGGHRAAKDVALRPGLHSVARGLDAWLRSWHAPKLPMLSMRQVDGALLVEDTRAIAAMREREVTGLARQVLLAADEGAPEARTRERLEQAGFSPAAIEAAIAELVKARLVLRLDGRLVGLPVWAPHILMPAPSAFPGGYFERRLPQLRLAS
jgi:ribosomal peptide maturation radical SAM protein 1